MSYKRTLKLLCVLWYSEYKKRVLLPIGSPCMIRLQAGFATYIMSAVDSQATYLNIFSFPFDATGQLFTS